MGTKSYGENVSLSNGRRSITKLGQLCYLLGKNGNGTKAALCASVSQVSFAYFVKCAYHIHPQTWNRMKIWSTNIIFYNMCFSSCLQSWLEQDTSCPTCRLGLSVQHAASMHPNIERIMDDQETNNRTNNHFFHFNGNFSSHYDIDH